MCGCIGLVMSLPSYGISDESVPESRECLPEKIKIEELKAAQAALQIQIMQFQFPRIQESAKKSEEEAVRLKSLLPKSGPEHVKDKE